MDIREMMRRYGKKTGKRGMERVEMMRRYGHRRDEEELWT